MDNLHVVPDSIAHDHLQRVGTITLAAPTRNELLAPEAAAMAMSELVKLGMPSPVLNEQGSPYPVDADGNAEKAMLGQTPFAEFRADFRFMSRL